MLLVAIVVDPRFRILITLIHSATISGLFPALWLVHWTKKISANTIPLFIVCKNTVFPHSFCHTFRMFRGDSKRMMEKNGVKAVVDWFFQLWPPAPKSFVNIEQLVWFFLLGHPLRYEKHDDVSHLDKNLINMIHVYSTHKLVDRQIANTESHNLYATSPQNCHSHTTCTHNALIVMLAHSPIFPLLGLFFLRPLVSAMWLYFPKKD